MKPLISIVIPAKNSENTLRRCIQSIKTQREKNYEIIIIDNNSNDKTYEIAKKIEKKEENVKVFIEKDKGRGAARNRGIIEAKGKVILMTDSDCEVSKDWVRKMTAPILNNKEKAVQGNFKEVENNKIAKKIEKANQNFFERSRKERYIDHIDTKNFAILSSLVKEIGFDSEIKNLEDLDLFVRIQHKTKILFLPDVKVKHNHPRNFLDLTKLTINRGFWTALIYKKHEYQRDLEFPIFKQINSKELAYTLIAALKNNNLGAIFWNLGIMAGLIKNLFSPLKVQKIIFIGVNKTASTSIKEFLYNSLGIKQEKHLRAVKHRERMGNREFDRCFKFAFIRNPWERFVSIYHYRKELKWGKNKIKNLDLKTVDKSFEEWIVSGDFLLPNNKKNILANYSAKQSGYIMDDKGKVIVNFIGRYETLEEDFKKACKIIGVKPGKLPVRNKTKHGNYRNYYNDKTKKIVERACKEDIELGGYKF